MLERLPYLAELAIDHIKELDHLILIGASAPVSFFAYPNVPSLIAPPQCEAFQLARPHDDIDQMLAALLQQLGGNSVEPDVHPLALPELATGRARCVQGGAGCRALPARERRDRGRGQHQRPRPGARDDHGPSARLS